MVDIRIVNGFVYINNPPDELIEELEWCDVDEKNPNKYYFLLNEWTRELFKRDVLPLIQQNKLSILNTELQTILSFMAYPPLSAEGLKIRPLPGITLLDHQVTAVQKMLYYKRYGIFLGPGTGKTIIAMTWLNSVRPNSALIVTPVKVVGQYREEIKKYFPHSNYIVTNYEQLNGDEAYDAVIFDESQKAKSYTSHTAQMCRLIANRASYRFIFTGTPQDKLEHETLSQLSIIDPRVMPSKTKVIERYFHVNDYYQPCGRRKSRRQELDYLIKRYTWGAPAESVISLTPKEEHIIECDVHPVYERLMADRVLPELDCVADSPALLRLYLREICSGSLFGKAFPNDKPYKLIEITKEMPQAIVYYEFTSSLPAITKALGEENCCVVNGSVSPKKTEGLIKGFKEGKYRFLVIQTASGNAGLDLTNTNNIIYYALPESSMKFEQSKKRIDRIGQKETCNYYYLVCKGTVEEFVLANLRKKKNSTDKLFQLYLNKRGK